jgi:ATP-dependent DNA ligase
MKAFSIDFEEAEKLEKEWVFEIKYDGVRQLFINGKLFSEFGVDNTQEFKHIRDEFKGIDAVLDGEVYLESGSSIEVKKKENWNRVKYVVFDILKLGDTNLMKLPLIERRKILFNLFNARLRNSKFVELSKGFFDFKEAWNYVLMNNLEGLVAKNLYSPYESDVNDLFKVKRSWSWLKIKNWKEGKERIVGFEKSGTNSKFSKGAFILESGTRISALSLNIVKEYENLKQFGNVVAEFYYLKKTKDGKYFHPKLKRLTIEEKIREDEN